MSAPLKYPEEYPTQLEEYMNASKPGAGEAQ